MSSHGSHSGGSGTRKVYGGGQPMPLHLLTAAAAALAAAPSTTAPVAASASGGSGAARPSAPSSAYSSANHSAGGGGAGRRINFGSASSSSASAPRADLSALGVGGSGPGGGGGSYGGFGSSGDSPGGGSSSDSGMLVGMAKAVGSALLYPLASMTGTGSTTPARLPTPPPAAAGGAQGGGASTFDPAQTSYPMLPRYRGNALELLQPVPFAASESPPHAQRRALHSQQEALRQAISAQQSSIQTQYLSSLLNSPAFSPDDLGEPPPFYLPPLPYPYNEPASAIRALVKEVHERSGVAEEYLVFASHHGSWMHPLQAHQERDRREGVGSLNSAAAEAHAARQYQRCIQLVPARYFQPDFSVANEALVFYEQQLAAAAAEAELEEEEENKRREAQANGTALSIPTYSSSSPPASSASGFYSAFSSPPPPSGGAGSGRGSGSARGDAAGSGTGRDSTYFQAAWAATHAPSTAPGDSIGIVPGMVDAVFVSPAKAAASLYKMFNKLTGGPRTISPTAGGAALYASSHQRAMGALSSKRGGGLGSARGALSSSPLPAPTAEDHNALQLQQRLAGYLDLVEVTLMQLVSSKSKSFFQSLTTIQLLNGEIDAALLATKQIRSSVVVLQQRLVQDSLTVVRNERTLRAARRTLSLLELVRAVSLTQSTIKTLLGTSEFDAAIQLVHATLDLVKTTELSRLRCLAQMEIKLKENLKLIDMLMMAEFVAIAMPEEEGGSSDADGDNDSVAHLLASDPDALLVQLKSPLRSGAQMSFGERERLQPLVQTLYSFGTILPTLLKYGQELREHVQQQLVMFCAEELARMQKEHSAAAASSATMGATASSAATGAESSPAPPSSANAAPHLTSSSSMGNLSSIAMAMPVNPAHASSVAAAVPSQPAPGGSVSSTVSTSTAAPSSSSSSSSSATNTGPFGPASNAASFMASWVPSALRRAGNTVNPTTSSSSSSSTASAAAGTAVAPEQHLQVSEESTRAGDFSGSGSSLSVPASLTSSTSLSVLSAHLQPEPSPVAAAVVVEPVGALVSEVSSLSHGAFLRFQTRLHARVLQMLYRAVGVRQAVLDAVGHIQSSAGASAKGSAPAQLHSISPERLQREFTDLFRSLICQSKDGGSESGPLERLCVRLIEPRASAHAALNLNQLKSLVECTMEFVREAELIAGSPCMELRRVLLTHEKAFLASMHTRLVGELTSALERDAWERVDVPRAFQVLVDSQFTRRTRGLRTHGAAATATATTTTTTTGAGMRPSASSDSLRSNGNGDTASIDSDEEDEDESGATAATYLFIENDSSSASSAAAAANDSSTSPVPTPSAVYAKYPVTSSVLTLLRLLGQYCHCAAQLKGVSLDILTRVVELLTIYNSRSVQLILGAGAMHFNPALRSITSKQLCLTTQCLSLLRTQLPVLRATLGAHFPAKFHGQLARDLERVRKDYTDHLAELMSKLKSMAMDVAEASCRASVLWIKREEEIAALASSKQPQPVPAAASLTNTLPSLFKQSSRLLTQTEALYQVVADVLQPDQSAQLMDDIARAYVRIFHAHFNAAPGAGAGAGAAASGGGGGVVVSQLASLSLRSKVSKRMEATLERFRPWISAKEFAHMKQELGIYLLQPAPSAPASATAAAASSSLSVAPGTSAPSASPSPAPSLTPPLSAPSSAPTTPLTDADADLASIDAAAAAASTPAGLVASDLPASATTAASASQDAAAPGATPTEATDPPATLAVASPPPSTTASPPIADGEASPVASSSSELP